MKLRSLRYYLTEAIIGLIKNRLMSVASIVTVSACIFLFALSYCLAANLDYILKQLEGSLTVTVIVGNEASADDVNTLNEKIRSMEHVLQVRYKTAKEALDEFKEDLKDKSGILDGLEKDNPLPRSFILELDDLRSMDNVVRQIEKLNDKSVEKIIHGRDTANLLMTLNNFIRVVSIIIIGALGVISTVIVMNTIRITVNARRNEIGIMKYVGATDWFIRWPFIFEGILIGVLGTVIPLLICWFGYGRVITFIEGIRIIPGMEFYTSISLFTILIPLSAIIGVVIGVTGSFTSVRKHLKV